MALLCVMGVSTALFSLFLAILEVHEDFFVYKSGIYRHIDVNVHKAAQYRKHGTHSVRIIG